MNTHNDFLDNAVNDELKTEGIGDLTTATENGQTIIG